MFNFPQFVHTFIIASGKSRINKDILNQLIQISNINYEVTDTETTRILQSKIDISDRFKDFVFSKESCIKQIKNIIDNYIDISNRPYLLASVIYGLNNDTTIINNELINPYSNLTKDDLKYKTDYSMYEFISGVYAYIITRPTKVENNSYIVPDNSKLNEIISAITIKENIIDDSIIKNTLNSECFFGVFRQYYHNEKLISRKSNSLDFYYLNPESTDYSKFDYSNLKKQIYKNIENFAFSRPEIQSIIDDGMKPAIIHQAIRRLKTSNRLHFEDVLLYVLLEYFLKAPKLLTSVEIERFDGKNLTKSSSIHILNKKFDTEDKFQLIFGVSCMANNLDKMIDDLFVRITSIVANDNERNQIINQFIIDASFDSEQANYIIDIYKNGFKFSSKGLGVFIGYKLNVPNDYKTRTEYDILFQKQLAKDICIISNKINSKLETLELRNYPFYVYIIPFNNPDEDKQSILDAIIEGDIL